MKKSASERYESNILFVATNFGNKYGGINGFNKDLMLSVKKIINPTYNIFCVVLSADSAEVKEAKDLGIHIIIIETGANEFKINILDLIILKIKNLNINTWNWVIGHDLITGQISFEISKLLNSKLALIHHMDYSSYKIFQNKDSILTYEEINEQKRVLNLADKVFAVGPFLKQTAMDITGREVKMLVPGLAEVIPKKLPNFSIKIITFGRFSEKTLKLKQHELAIKAFARAIKLMADVSDIVPNVKLTLVGVENSIEKTSEYLELAEIESGRSLPILSLPYIENRMKLMSELIDSDLCLMLSLQEGFGMVGWEAISAEVPLIMSKQSGLYQFLFNLGGFATGSIMGVDITGIEEKDIENVSKIIQKFLIDPVRARKNIKDLKFLLINQGFTWRATARAFLNELDIPTKETMDRIPFKFLKNFDEKDNKIFFGRESEIEVFLNQLKFSEYSLLFGKSGVGKTSFLLAGIIPNLKKMGLLPVYIRSNSYDINDVSDTISIQLKINPNSSDPTTVQKLTLSLKNFLENNYTNQIVLIFDQFEEIFVGHSSSTLVDFFKNISELAFQFNGQLKVVFAFREDFMAEFQDYTVIIKNIFQNSFRLKSFNKELAEYVIKRSLETSELKIEDGLLLEIISSLSESKAQFIEPAQLQIVLTTLFTKLDKHQKKITIDHYNNLGGVKGILADYIDSSLESFTDSEKVVVKEMLKNMVSSLNTRIPLKMSQIVELPQIKGNYDNLNLIEILNKLINQRLIVRKSNEDTYELTHEYLINKIKEWIEIEHYKIKEIQDLLRQEEYNWKIGNIIIDRIILQMIEKNKELIAMDNYSKGIILRGSIEYDINLDYWIIANKDSELANEFIYQALSNKSDSVKRRAIIAALQILSFSIDYQSKLDDIKKIGNPDFLNTLKQINLFTQKLSENQIIEISDCIDYRIKQNMVLVEKGDFIFGRDQNEIDEVIATGVPSQWVISEVPRRKLNLNSFMIDKYLVTNSDYLEFNSEHKFKDGDENKPVTDINWFEAKRYAEWLGKDLPTEYEWEKAARGNDGRLFPWGNEWDPNKCNTRLSGISGKTVVNNYPDGVSPYCCYDMAGNVWEWTNTRNSIENSIIVRGGSWSRFKVLPWCSYRFDYDASDGQQNLGFRCVIRNIEKF